MDVHVYVHVPGANVNIVFPAHHSPTTPRQPIMVVEVTPGDGHGVARGQGVLALMGQGEGVHNLPQAQRAKVGAADSYLPQAQQAQQAQVLAPNQVSPIPRQPVAAAHAAQGHPEAHAPHSLSVPL